MGLAVFKNAGAKNNKFAAFEGNLKYYSGIIIFFVLHPINP
jgi:hypothetical protein